MYCSGPGAVSDSSLAFLVSLVSRLALGRSIRVSTPQNELRAPLIRFDDIINGVIRLNITICELQYCSEFESLAHSLLLRNLITYY
jgi:hypothetical protein